MNIGLLLLRLAVGLTVAAHGAQKLFGWFGGPGLDGTGQFFEMIGFRTGRRHATMAGLGEVVGGLLLTLGLLTPLGAAAVIIVMIVAIFPVHINKGFFGQNGGYEYNLLLATAALTIALTGPGSLSLDALLGNSPGGLSAGLTALFVAILASAVLLAQRRTAPGNVK